MVEHIVIRLKPDLPLGGQEGAVALQPLPVGEPAFKLPVLMPGVAEVDIDPGHLPGQQQLGQVLRIPQHQFQVGQGGGGQPLGRVQHHIGFPFQGDEVPIRVQLGHPVGKLPLAAAQLQMQRRRRVGERLGELALLQGLPLQKAGPAGLQPLGQVVFLSWAHGFFPPLLLGIGGQHRPGQGFGILQGAELARLPPEGGRPPHPL